MKFDFSDLVDQKLVTRKDIGNGLYLYKYARKVFYDNLWHLDSRLLEARGIVTDAEGNVVVWPFTKVFNRFENGTDVDRDREVVAVRKVNGFMASARYYKGELLITTTGSGDSDFVALARKHLDPVAHLLMVPASLFTLVFEICDSSDPHIVEEDEGAYLIGARYMQHCQDAGEMMSEILLDIWAEQLHVKRPTTTGAVPFSVVTQLVKEVDHEGYMIRDAETGETLMKIKSPHYLSKKALMRMGKRAVDQMFDNPEQFRQRLDEEFYRPFECILRTFSKEQWGEMSELQRRYWLENWFEIFA